jgi:hypothetical protein
MRFHFPSVWQYTLFNSYILSLCKAWRWFVYQIKTNSLTLSIAEWSNYGSQGAGLSSQTTQHVSASYGHSCTVLLGDFSLGFAYSFIKVCMKKTKSCNLNLEFLQIALGIQHWHQKVNWNELRVVFSVNVCLCCMILLRGWQSSKWECVCPSVVGSFCYCLTLHDCTVI